jgi:miniconductance mechanosensitive channel
MKEIIINWIRSFYYSSKEGITTFDQLNYDKQAIYWAIAMLLVLVFASILLWFITRFIMVRILHVVIDKSKVTWDDHLVNNKVFKSLAHLVPLMFMEYFLQIVFYQYSNMNVYWSMLVHVLIILAVMYSINRALNAFRDIIQQNSRYQDKPIQSYFQVLKIASSGIFIILMLSVVSDKSPIFFLTSLGAISAILLLIFKDTILGFVGSIQLAANDMIHIGDWITMERYGADGDVVEINLATVKVQNFDKTITTIPTYSFISDSFKNWRGMEDSEGRRIKRSINLQLDSITFASKELLDKLAHVRLLKDFIAERQTEIEAYNKELQYDEQFAINGRRQTNVGLFRKYIEFYLNNNVNINQNMPLMVRQLNSSPTGLPLEIYCFSYEKEWVKYEAIMADIFDHVYAVAHFFDLNIFESPSGKDFKKFLSV